VGVQVEVFGDQVINAAQVQACDLGAFGDVLGDVAGDLTEVDLAAETDPMEVLRFSATGGSLDLVRQVDDELSAAELAAVPLAMPTPGAAELIAAARHEGRPVAVVSNNSSAAIRAYLQTHDLADDIAHVVGRRRGDPKLMKPNPEPILEALRCLATTPTAAVLIGDSTADVEAARAAGVRCIGFANRGYRYDRLTEAGADAVIKSMVELL
jgi:HAD superfamily hydrolase (TIGR01509 family)